MGRSSKDKRDIYYRLAKEQGWRARSAFKLIQIDESLHILQGVRKVVDLCAAPGSWSQVLASRLLSEKKREEESGSEAETASESKKQEGNDSFSGGAAFADGAETPAKIVAVDLQAMAPIKGVVRIQGDITQESTVNKILAEFEGEKADLVVCDGAPDVTGYHDMDQYIQSQLLVSAINITTNLLRPGGDFLAKIFRGKDMAQVLHEQLSMLFNEVVIVKPCSSRSSSIEAFVAARNYSPPDGFQPILGNPALHGTVFYNKFKEKLTGVNRKIIPFLLCGDLSGWDPDRNYPLKLNDDHNYEFHPATQPPIEPPYSKACQLRRTDALSKKEMPTKYSEISNWKTEDDGIVKESKFANYPFHRLPISEQCRVLNLEPAEIQLYTSLVRFHRTGGATRHESSLQTVGFRLTFEENIALRQLGQELMDKNSRTKIKKIIQSILKDNDRGLIDLINSGSGVSNIDKVAKKIEYLSLSDDEEMRGRQADGGNEVENSPQNFDTFLSSNPPSFAKAHNKFDDWLAIAICPEKSRRRVLQDELSESKKKQAKFFLRSKSSER